MYNALLSRLKRMVFQNLLIGSPKGNRTPDSAVRGRRLNRLTMGPCVYILSKKS